MAYDANKPANDDFIADAPQELRTNFDGLKNDQLVNAGLLNGLKSGNAQGNIPVSNGTVNTGLNADKLDGNDASAFANATHGHTVATGSSDGFMANTDKQKIDTVAIGAEVNQMAFSNVQVGDKIIQADSKTDTLEIVAGTNISVVADAVNDRLTFSVTGKVDSAASADTAGACTGNATTSSNCTGNSATATSSPLLSALSTYLWKAADLPSAFNLGITTSFVQPPDGWSNYGSVITAKAYSGGGGSLQLYAPYSPNNGGTRLQYRLGNYEVSSGNSWTPMQTIANLSDIPTTLPANGGNSATVGGYAPSAFLLSNSPTILNVLNNGGAQGMNIGSLLVSDVYVDRQYVPPYGGYIKGNLFINEGKQVATTDQIPAAFDAGHSFATNGWQKLSNGLILQWGDSANASTTPFPIAFPNGCLGIATAGDGSSGNAVAWWQMKVMVTNTSIINPYSDAIHYIAIGY